MNIMNTTATTEIRMPVTTFVVRASPKTNVPTRMAVTGSKTPRTDAFVAPMFLVATARVAVETMVGNIASPVRLIHALPPSMPAISSAPDVMLLVKKTAAPTASA